MLKLKQLIDALFKGLFADGHPLNENQIAMLDRIADMYEEVEKAEEELKKIAGG